MQKFHGIRVNNGKNTKNNPRKNKNAKYKVLDTQSLGKGGNKVQRFLAICVNNGENTKNTLQQPNQKTK